MSDGQKWRPPVAPKPTLRLGENRESNAPSASALRGATLAFGPAAAKSTSAVAPQQSVHSSRNAAAWAEKHGRQEQKTVPDTRNASSPVRGRSQLSLDLQRATDHNSRIEGRNPLRRTASEIAARAASASSSPAPSQAAFRRPTSPSRIPRSPSQESSSSQRGPRPSDCNARSDPRGATASMAASPVSSTTSPFSTKTGKLDFNRIPSLARQVTSPVSVQRQQPPKPQIKPPIVDTNVDGNSNSRAEPPPPPAARLSHKRPQHEPKDKTDSPVSASTPIVTLSEPEGSDVNMSKAANPPKKVSQPIQVPPKRTSKTSPNTSVSPHKPEAPSRSLRSHMTVNELSDAMVGASLASSRQGSRAASPAKFKPPSLPRRRSQSVDLLKPSMTGDKNPPLKPLPRRAMKQTLRKESPEHEDEEDTRRGRKHRIRKHPHMHSEGDRKRWRDKVSEAERKRYEGVWAANRGLLHNFEQSSILGKRPPESSQEEMVLNVVVQDIWNRSRLPRDVLEEVWDLVSPEPEYKALNRERFVVGMWLVDQRLKGRKLPVRVSASVWQSVQLVRGIKVSSKPF